MNTQKKALELFFPAMYLCATSGLIGIWLGDVLPDIYFRIIPTLFIIGLASLITWAVSIVIELRDIAYGKGKIG